MPRKRTGPGDTDRELAGLGFREISIRAATLNSEERTVEADISTETPVPMWDWQRSEIIPEILLADGYQLAGRAKQVPLLDSHSRWSTSSILGSAREIATVGDRVRAVLHFSAASEDAFVKAREGHLTDVSVGYQVLARTFIAAGVTKKIRGREFTGPANVVTKWRLLEVSTTSIGADEQAKLRGLDPASLIEEGSFDMNPELRAWLVSLGMAEDLDDDAAQRWLIDPANADKIRGAFGTKPKKVGGDGDDATGGGNLTEDGIRRLIADALKPDALRGLLDSAVQTAITAENQRRAQFRTQVDQMVELTGITPDAELTRSLYDLETIDKVRERLLEERANRATNSPTAPITFGAAQRDKHLACLETAMMERILVVCSPLHDDSAAAARRQKVVDQLWPAEKRAKDWQQFRYAGLLDLATECLRMDGIDVRGLTPDDIAIAALGFTHAVGVRSDAGYHSTASFPKLTQDAVNKSMMLGYSEFPSTWRGPMTQGPSAKDFKTIHRMQLGAAPNLPIWNDRKDPDKASMPDAEETYAVECRSLALDFNYRLIVNDDIGLITRSPMKLGDAAHRTVNAVAWAQITSNPLMRDGVALFAAATGARKRTNLTTGAGAPSVATVQTLTNLMMQMRGENTPEGNESEDILGLTPVYIAAGSALRTTILQLVNSVADPASSNAGVHNPVRNNLVPIIEPLLDANSITAWYLFASTHRCETVEVTFLQGQEQPRVRMINDEKRLSREFIVLQTFAAKALDHRGIQKHAGA